MAGVPVGNEHRDFVLNVRLTKTSKATLDKNREARKASTRSDYVRLLIEEDDKRLAQSPGRKEHG